MKKPSVSVIIPVYNRKELFLEAVESVMSQSFRDFELIVADDCSTEDLKSAVAFIPGISEITEIKVCRKELSGRSVLPELYSQGAGNSGRDSGMLPGTTYPAPEEDGITLKWLRFEKHSGMAGMVRNRGVEAASADYIAFLDSDDLWVKDKLEKQFNFMQKLKKDNIRISHTREKWLRCEKTVSQKSQKHKREGDIFEDALWKCIIGPSTVMLEKSLFAETGGFREDLEVAEDYELWLRITDHEMAAFIDEMLTVKRAGEWDQLSEKYGQIEIFRIDALKGLLEIGYFTEGRRIMAERVFSKKCGIYAAGCRKRGKDEEAAYYERLSIKYLQD